MGRLSTESAKMGALPYRLTGLGAGLAALGALFFGQAGRLGPKNEVKTDPASTPPVNRIDLSRYSFGKILSGVFGETEERGNVSDEKAGSGGERRLYSAPKVSAVLKRGDSGLEVKALQRALNATALFAEINCDGDFGPKTEEIVKRFQIRFGLPPDGKVGPKTREALERALKEVEWNSRGILSGIGLDKDRARAKPADLESFNLVVERIFGWEGEVNSDRADNGNCGGNVTNRGITQATYDQYRRACKLPLRSTLELKKEEAKAIYYEMYWLKARCHLLPEKLSIVHLDSAVNMGVERACQLLQRALNRMQPNCVAVDGKIGAKTLRAVRELVITEQDAKILAGYYLDEREKDYRRIAEFGRNSRFLKGWLNRLNQNRVAVGLLPLEKAPLMAVAGVRGKPLECVPLDDPRVELGAY